jgi:hypothetical protein
MGSNQETPGLSGVPHFTILQKFLCRIKSLYLRILFWKNSEPDFIQKMMVLHPLFLRANRETPKTFPEGIDLNQHGSPGNCRFYFLEQQDSLIPLIHFVPGIPKLLM